MGRWRVHRLTINYAGCRHDLAILIQAAQHQRQDIDAGETDALHEPPEPVVHYLFRQNVTRQHALFTLQAHQIAQRVDHRSKACFTRASNALRTRQQELNQRAFLIRYICRITSFLPRPDLLMLALILLRPHHDAPSGSKSSQICTLPQSFKTL